MKITVIGAGIAGITAAYYAAKNGHEVTVYDIEKYPAMRTSYANGGQVSVCNSEVWTTWSNILKGVYWMFKKDAPLLIRPSLDLDKIIWLSKFIYHTANNEYARNTIETIKMGLEARKLYNEICVDEHLLFDRKNCGILHIYKDEKYFNKAVLAQEMFVGNGCDWDILNVSDIYKLEPALKTSSDIIGGVFTHSDWVGDIHKFCYGLASILSNKYHVKFDFETDYKDIPHGYDAIVVAAGVGSVEIAKLLKDKLPIYPVKGYSITIPTGNIMSHKSMPKVSLLDDQAKIVCSFLGDKFRVAGTAEFDGENYDIRKDRIDPLLKWIHTNFPNVNTHEYSSWACLRPMTPNMLPIVSRSKYNNKTYYHTGHGHLGWTLAPYTAKNIVKMIEGDYNER